MSHAFARSVAFVNRQFFDTPGLPVSGTRGVMGIPWWVQIGAFLGLAVRLLIAWQPPAISFALSVPDDGYYYFTIARNIASGVGVTFDGLAPTNGFHPLWMALITPFWLIAGDSPNLPIHMSLSLGAILFIPTALMVWVLGIALGLERRWAGVGVLLYAWNPYSIAASVNGLETAISTMLFVLSLFSYWQLRQSQSPSRKQWLILAFLWSLLMLARTDYAFILLPCGIDVLWQQRRQLQYAWVVPVAMVLWFPWLTWNWVTFGTFSQVSGNAYPYYLRTIWQSEAHTLSAWIAQEIRMAYGIVANLGYQSGFNKSVILLVGFIVVVSVMLFVSSRYRTTASSPAAWTRIAGLWWPTLGSMALLLFHGLVRWMYVPWYFVPLSILLVLWFAIALQILAGVRFWGAAALSVLVLGFQVFSGVQIWQSGGMWLTQSQDANSMLIQLQQDCEHHDPIGVSDAGYFGYFAPCRIVNLDGVVNNQAFAAIRSGRFRFYLDEAGIKRIYINDIIRRVVALREGELPSDAPFASAQTQ